MLRCEGFAWWFRDVFRKVVSSRRSPPYSPYRFPHKMHLIRDVSGAFAPIEVKPVSTGGVASYENLNCSSVYCTTDTSKALMLKSCIRVFRYRPICTIVQTITYLKRRMIYNAHFYASYYSSLIISPLCGETPKHPNRMPKFKLQYAYPSENSTVCVEYDPIDTRLNSKAAGTAGKQNRRGYLA